MIENTLASIGIDPEKHFDKTVPTVKKKRDLSKDSANRTKPRLPVLPSIGQQAPTSGLKTLILVVMDHLTSEWAGTYDVS